MSKRRKKGNKGVRWVGPAKLVAESQDWSAGGDMAGNPKGTPYAGSGGGARPGGAKKYTKKAPIKGKPVSASTPTTSIKKKK